MLEYLAASRETSHAVRLLLGAVGAGVGALCADDPGWWACMMVSHGARARGPPQLPAAIPSDNDHSGSWTPVRCQWRSRDGGFESRPPVADRRCRHRHCRCPLRAHPACLPLCGMGRCGACLGATCTQAACVDWRKSGVESLRRTPARTARGQLALVAVS